MTSCIPPKALRLLLPETATADLVLASVLDGDPARDAWRRWTGSAGSVFGALSRDAVVARALLPLLYDSSRRNELEVDDETTTYLRSAYVHERMRSHAYREIVAGVGAHLESARVDFSFIKGAAIGNRYYADEALRHSHDVELVVSDVREAGEVLRRAGFRGSAGFWLHGSGLPVRLHDRFFTPSLDFEESAIRIAASHTLDATQDLAVVLVHVSRSASRRNGRWVADVRAIDRKGDVDWAAVAAIVIGAGASIAAATQLEWLSERGVAHVSPPVIRSVQTRAEKASSREVIMTTRGLYAGSATLWRELWSTGDTRFRWTLLRSILPG